MVSRLETVSDVAAGLEVAPPRPGALVKFWYALGQLAQSGGFDTALGFVFFYYTAVLGLSGAAVGAALAVSLAFDAVVDPLVGSWSDNIRSRLGRRLPPMLIAAPLMFVAMGALFAPLALLPKAGLVVWLAGSLVGVRSFISLFNVPYFALGGELADDYAERSRIVAWRAVAGILAGVLVTALAFMVFFTGRQGLLRPAGYPGFGWTVGAIIGAASLLCVAGLRRFAPTLPSPAVVTVPLWRRLPGELAQVFRNRNFLVLFFSAVVLYVGVGVNSTLNNHVNVFVWKLTPVEMQLLGYAYLAGLLAGVPMVPTLARRLEKKTIVIIGLVIVFALWTAVPGARAIGWFHPVGAAALPPLALFVFVIGVAVGFCAVAYPSMMADAADEHEYLSGRRREGLYFAGLGFAAKAATGLGALVAGLALDLIGFPHQVSGATRLGAALSARLMLAYGPGAAAFGALALAIFAPYGITRARQRRIAAALRERRAAAA